MVRVWIVGLGTVGRWVGNALTVHADRLADRYGVSVVVVGVANARDGFVYREDGLDVPALLASARAGRSLAEASQPGAQHWATACDGLRATEADVLVETAASPASDGEPGYTHMREVLQRGIPVVTSNKWPVALHGVELAEHARRRGVPFRAESSVMSGTPLLSALVDGLAGAVPIGLRGVLNATANDILTAMAGGKSYEQALADAQEAGLAERDPAADVEGSDTVAKVMILAALVFGRQLRTEEVVCRGITGVTGAEVDQAVARGGRIRHVASLGFAEPGGAGAVDARVEPVEVGPDDPLAAIDGTTNAVVFRADPVGQVTIAGPGAGPELAGQGVFSDLIAVARRPLRAPG
jgi:homoserine dehydrogenase